MTKHKNWHNLSLFFTITGSLLLTNAKAQDAYLWTIENKAGDTEKFRTYIKIKGKTLDMIGEISIFTKSTSKHTYKEIDADGNATYDQLDEKFDGIFNGTLIQVKPADFKPITVKRAKTGVYLSRLNPKADVNTGYQEKVLLPTMSIPAPEKPVKVGESWKTVIINPLLKGKMIEINSTLVGVVKTLGQDALKINVTMEFPPVPGAKPSEIVKLQETYFLSVIGHQLLQARYTIKNPFMPFPSSSAEAKAFVTRVIAGVNEADDPDELSMLGVEKTDK